jgi:hypothetical protein
MEYLTQLQGSVALGTPAVNDHVLSEGPNLARKAVEADSPEEAADILLSELTDRSVVDEVWVTHDDHTWIYGNDGALVREERTSDLG